MNALLFYSGIRKTFNTKALLLVVFWIAGLLASAYSLNDASISLMLTTAFSRITLTGLLFSLVLPILLTRVVLRYLNFYLILPLAFIKSFLFFYCFCGITLAFGDAGWLFGRMICFSDSILVLVLLLQWFDAAAGKRYNHYQLFILNLAIPITVGILDYFVVSPFLAMLLNY